VCEAGRSRCTRDVRGTLRTVEPWRPAASSCSPSSCPTPSPFLFLLGACSMAKPGPSGFIDNGGTGAAATAPAAPAATGAAAASPPRSALRLHLLRERLLPPRTSRTAASKRRRSRRHTMVFALNRLRRAWRASIPRRSAIEAAAVGPGRWHLLRCPEKTPRSRSRSTTAVAVARGEPHAAVEGDAPAAEAPVRAAHPLARRGVRQSPA